MRWIGYRFAVDIVICRSTARQQGSNHYERHASGHPRQQYPHGARSDDTNAEFTQAVYTARDDVAANHRAHTFRRAGKDEVAGLQFEQS